MRSGSGTLSLGALIGTMNSPRAVAWRDSVLDCGKTEQQIGMCACAPRPLPLFLACTGWESARGLRNQNCNLRRAHAGKQSKTWRLRATALREAGWMPVVSPAGDSSRVAVVMELDRPPAAASASELVGTELPGLEQVRRVAPARAIRWSGRGCRRRLRRHIPW